MSDFISPGSINGSVRLYHVLDGLWEPATPYFHNLVLYGWAGPVAKLLSTGNSAYKIGGIYFEFENVASPGDAVSIPSFDRGDPSAYYSGLGVSGDYIRQPLTAATVSSTDKTKYPDGNRVSFFAQTQGAVEGENGLSFGETYNSKVFGGALVAFPNESDPSRDVVFSRFYYQTSEQQLKLDTSNLGIEWRIDLM